MLLVFLRKKFKKALKGELYREKLDYIDKECSVIEKVTVNTAGRISFQGTTWDAFSTKDVIKKKSKAVIVSKKPGKQSVFIIKKIKE